MLEIKVPSELFSLEARCEEVEETDGELLAEDVYIWVTICWEMKSCLDGYDDGGGGSGGDCLKLFLSCRLDDKVLD